MKLNVLFRKHLNAMYYAKVHQSCHSLSLSLSLSARLSFSLSHTHTGTYSISHTQRDSHLHPTHTTPHTHTHIWTFSHTPKQPMVTFPPGTDVYLHCARFCRVGHDTPHTTETDAPWDRIGPGISLPCGWSIFREHSQSAT